MDCMNIRQLFAYTEQVLTDNTLQLIRDLFIEMSGQDPIEFPEPLPIKAYGSVRLNDFVPLLDALPQLYPGEGIASAAPERMENYDQA